MVEKDIDAKTDEPNFDRLTELAWQMGTSQPQEDMLWQVGENEAKHFAFKAFKRIHLLEQEARKPLLERITPTDIKDTRWAWNLSAPGTFFLPIKDDRYAGFPYTRWWDAKQIKYAAGFAIIVGRQRAGFPAVGKLSEDQLSESINKAPILIYNGRDDENRDLERAINEGRLPYGFPIQKVHIINTKLGKKFNSLGQVQNLTVPSGEKPSEGELMALFARPAQILRVLHKLNEEKNRFPKGVRLKPFPVRTSRGGLYDHWIREVCGLWYYRYSSGDAAEEPYPIHGNIF